MRRAIYRPSFPSSFFQKILGWDPKPVEVELLEYVEPETSQQVRLARIIHPTDEKSILGIAARSRGMTGPLPGLERLVPAEHVHEIEAEA